MKKLIYRLVQNLLPRPTPLRRHLAAPALSLLALTLPPAVYAANPQAEPSAEQAAERAILPLLDVFATPPANGARACRIQGRVESVAGQAIRSLPAFDFAVEPPGRMRLSFPMTDAGAGSAPGGTLVTACRDQQRLWASPGAVVRPLLEMLSQGENGKRPRRSGDALRPIQIPLSGQHLALLPVLLEVQGRGESPVDGAPCRVVDARIQQDVARLLPAAAQGWAVRLWLNPAGRPVRAGSQRPGGSIVVRIDQIQLEPALPAELWAAPADAAVISPTQLGDLVNRISRFNPDAQ